MTTKAIVTPRSAATGQFRPSETESDAGVEVEAMLAEGAVVKGAQEQLEALEAQGYRVKMMPGAGLIDLGATLIDTESDAESPPVPAELEVPAELADEWPHHLIQLVAPPRAEWLAEIEARGVDVIEPTGAYGVLVSGTPDAVARLIELTFVTWTGPMKPAYRIHPNLADATGTISYVSVSVYPPSAVDEVRQAVEEVNGTVVSDSRAESDAPLYATISVEIDAESIPTIARLPHVRLLERVDDKPGLDGERESQLVREQIPPTTGYLGWLASVGLGGGTGVNVAICDTGVDKNATNNTTGHLDIRGRQVAFVNYDSSATILDVQGHGTHVAGIAVGNGGSGDTEGAAPDDFLSGLGVAPQSGLVTQNGLEGPWPPADFGQFTRDAVNNGAAVQNNSWFSSPAGSGYTAAARRYDQLVRDPDDATAGLDSLVIVFSAGNAGGRSGTITGPKEAKNVIVVGNSLNARPGQGFPSDDVQGIASSSSRGPAADGRILPNVCAPGTDVNSAQAGTGGHVLMTGTSMAAPHVTGAIAVIIEWWRARTGGATPSAAMAKALVINGAEDMAGGPNWRSYSAAEWTNLGGGLRSVSALGHTPAEAVDQAPGGVFGAMTQVGSVAAVVSPGHWHYDAGTDVMTFRPISAGATRLNLRDTAPLTSIPNNDQGWGRVSLENVLEQAPVSDRGPKIFSDQRHAFTSAGQEHLIRVAPADPTRPLRITLAWTDAPGAVVANPAIVNDLDLEVTELDTGVVFKGNVFAGGFSAAGGVFDNINNIECVYLQNPAGTYEVRVIAAAVSASARPDIATPWQDFALVIDNAEVPPAAPVSVVPVIDRSGSMIVYGYEAVTRTASKQFLDLMSLDDQVGVVSFGSTGDVEFPTGPAPAAQTITGQPVRDAAKAEVDTTVFGGCTFMGEGIVKARDLLATSTVTSRAMVLLSDGYDNKGCDAANPAKPSALDAVATLPSTVPVYTCAMGPASDQALLEQIADISDGRYYFMPTIDDLFEIYNYIRGQVSGDGIVVNESALASTSRVAAFVDDEAAQATFTVSWADTSLRFVAESAKKADQICVRLRDPKGRLVPAHSSLLRRTEGRGYVAFDVAEPLAGKWFIEVSTARERHTRFTAAGFVRSPIHLHVSLGPRRFTAGSPLLVTTKMTDGNRLFNPSKPTGLVVAPALSLQSLSKTHAEALRGIDPVKVPDGDSMPQDVGKLLALRARLLAAGKPDLFQFAAARMRLSDTMPRRNGGAPEAALPLVTGRFTRTTEAGSYNVRVTATGRSPHSGHRYVRTQLASTVATP
ncbi:peptidase S8 and S53, subtilisin, kexin, sedolisin [Alloactinosynnema sp. L-07]|uniref:S8 family serine peptidase n=1 Tax=Alloactinosynnema sp. L-07 TaxID=1653480 RepID=UPI00065EF00B|nr:S8 family serine peptidase [Alloactinosynnema sp. L-07]CRK56578.1 peptidase S8 and S53, subtilisin, kexin, sedolisin [Alloactinosynnema sp. L-07]